MKDLGSDMLRINSTLAVAQFVGKGRLIKFLTRCRNENSIVEFKEAQCKLNRFIFLAVGIAFRTAITGIQGTHH